LTHGSARERTSPKSLRVLSDDERANELLFGLIMVMTFTGSLSAATAGKDEVREMLIGAVGCNVAWGIVDAVMYLMTTLSLRGAAIDTLRRVRAAGGPDEARGLIVEELPEPVAQVMTAPEIADLHARLSRLPEPPTGPRLTKRDYWGALGVFLLVAVATLPVVVPFVVIPHTHRAVRWSHAIAIAMMFTVGLKLGRRSRVHPVGMGIATALLGVLLAAMTMALGG
jgi:VIT1/CCC1 family predicted Fe2+/Mn2+ transporter